MKKLLITLIVVILVAGAAGGAYYYKYGKPPEPEVSFVQVTRGDVIKAVGATGSIEAVTTVDVGTQVNGVIKDLYGTDFNSIVKKGQLIAKIDPATIEAQIEQDNAQLANAEANLERQGIALEDSRNKLKRAEDLFKRNLITQQDLETAQVTFKTNEASIKSQQASITQINATKHQHEVNLGYTNIYAPIDGIVINRKVDIGQTVVSNNAATSMYQIAADLTKMQVKASVDESDVGLLRPGQRTTFRVDAFPNKEFVGTVAQVRLQPVVSQNVVTYTTMINVPNPNLELKPGMTANVKIEIAKAENVLRVPLSATRFRPTREIFEALNLEVPPELLQRGRGGQRGNGQNAMAGSQNGMAAGQNAMAGGQSGMGGGTRGSGAFERGGGDRPTQPADQQVSFRRGESQQGGQGQAPGNRQSRGEGQQATGGDRQAATRGDGGGQGGERQWGGGGRGGQQMTPEERQKRMQERLAQMTPEQRAQFEERMKQFAQGGGRGQGSGRQGGERGQAFGGPGVGGGQRAQGGQPGEGGRFGGQRNRPAANEVGPTEGIADRGASTIDALFGDLSFADMPARVWVYSVDGTKKNLKSITIRYRIDDGTMAELVTGEGITEGMRLVSTIDLGTSTQQVRPNSSPLMPGGQRGGPGGFGGPGGGRGR